jgi:predicted ribosome quality control (RQC) complex YloA/Tae2 family protein
LKKTDGKEKYKVYGELLTTYGYQLSETDTSLTCVNYYNNEEITIPVDETMTAIENANKYFARYNKLKRTEEAVKEQQEETEETITHQYKFFFCRWRNDCYFVRYGRNLRLCRLRLQCWSIHHLSCN